MLSSPGVPHFPSPHVLVNVQVETTRQDLQLKGCVEAPDHDPYVAHSLLLSLLDLSPSSPSHAVLDVMAARPYGGPSPLFSRSDPVLLP